MATVKREFLLANRPVTPGDGRQRYEVNMHVDGNRERSVLMVDARDAVDTLEAIRAVYGLGQEDTAQTPETAAEAPEVKPAPVSYPDDDEAPETPVHIRLLGRQDTPYRIGLGRWIDVIHVANGLWPGMFGAAESEDKWVEEYHDASVVFREDGTASVIAKTNRGDRTLRAAAAFLGVTTGN
jgi:hypothetical protein